MSVPTWKRNESVAEYVWQIRQLNIDIAEIISNKPKKYKSTHSDLLVKTALEALANANMANDIYVQDDKDYDTRRRLLIKAKGQLYNIALLSDIFLELCKKSPNCDRVKCVKDQYRIGDRCKHCINLISGVLKSDKKRYKSK